MPPTLPPPKCRKCGKELSVATDTFRSRKQKQSCSAYLLPARTYQRNNASTTAKRQRLAEPTKLRYLPPLLPPKVQSPTPVRLNPLLSLLRTQTPLLVSSPANVPTTQLDTRPSSTLQLDSIFKDILASLAPSLLNNSIGTRMLTTRYTPIRSQNASSLYSTTSVFASQLELEAAESNNNFSISQGISLAKLKSAERYIYNMLCTLPPLNLEV